MLQKILFRWFISLFLLAGFLSTTAVALASQPQFRAAQDTGVTAFDLIIAMNTMRMSNGLPALVEDPIINAVAQSTAEIMAANQMSWHIGDVGGRLAAAGYGGGTKVVGTENFAVATGFSIDQIMQVWADPSHMIPAVNPAYCHVGAGVAKSSNGRIYYVLQAAYAGGKACGEYKSSGGTTNQPGGTTDQGRAPGVSQLIVPVKVATPDADGKIFHEVQAGQSFWSIAVAYKITIHDIEIWNNISRDSKLQVGQSLFIPGENTEGYVTPTPVSLIQISTPEPDGKIIHTVQAYQTLSMISEAYKVTIDTILAMNGIQADWPLQIGQKLIIYPGNVTPSPTPRPLTPLERLTPESDGKYYHTIQSGETLSGIAQLYEVSLNDLMAWNGLNAASILYPEKKLVLQVMPPATETPTPGPPTDTPTPTQPPPTLTPSPTRTTTQTMAIPTAALVSASAGAGDPGTWILALSLAGGGLLLVALLSRKKNGR